MRIFKTSMIALVSLALVIAVFIVTGLVYYHDSYSAATRIGDWRRIPLVYPWHIVDYGRENSGVKLEDWRVYVGEIEARKPGPVPMGTEPERESLQTLKFIGRFGFGNGYLYGVRDVYCPPNSKGEVDVPKWFILKCGEDTPCYYDSEEDYKRQCASLRIAAGETRSFSEQWDAFHKSVFQKSILAQTLTGWRCLVMRKP